jgi:hypothetical protein
MKSIFILISFMLTLGPGKAFAQFAPQVPLPGNEGIVDTSYLFQDWASGCTLYRGWLDIANKSLGQPTLGAPNDVYGPPGSGLLSLGDSGVAVVTFNHSIFNGAGPDFAVFENAFANPENDTLAYLEFAFVEVSSDGVNFVRFPASCNMQDTTQMDNFTYTDARFYNNLAGKYVSHYGTPFDLEELKGTPGLDVNNITYVRIVDAIGTINPLYASHDHSGNIINDPYPSAFASGGFDLAGVGVMNSNQPPTSIHEPLNTLQVKVYPNPASEMIYIKPESNDPLEYKLTDISGRKVSEGKVVKNAGIDISKQVSGLYLLYVSNNKKEYSIIKISKR